jgi:hypothetical protein
MATEKKQIVDLLDGKKFSVREGALSLTLAPGECIVAEY